MTANQDVNTLRNPQDPILVVDDDPVQHVLIKGFLRNWQVIFASSALEALKILTNQDILLVVTDLHMPGMDGMDLLRRIKQHNGTVQVIVITASEQTEDLVDALRAGANDFLLKPLERQALEEVLENALTRINRWKQSLMTLFNKKIGHGRLDATQAN